MNGPLLIACNHPNSFLDAVILDILFEKPIWSLARGDVFKKPWQRKWLKRLKMFPVYRTSEGVENLESNYTTFESCREVFKEKGIVLMFSEGKCINEWHLRPLKKGTARLAISAWEENIPLVVLPVGINYSSFRKFGKNIFINFSELITREQVSRNVSGLMNNEFNDLLRKELEKCVYEIQPLDKETKKARLSVPVSNLFKSIMLIPAVLGFIVNAPFYLTLRWFTKKSLRDIEHYDSLLTALLVILYPLYLLLIIIVLFFVSLQNWSLPFIFAAIPGAWCFVQIRKQLDD